MGIITTTVFQRFSHLSRCYLREAMKIEKRNNFNFPELQIEILTCGELYKKWRKEKRFWRIPKESLYFNISYIDTSVLDGGCKRDNDAANRRPVAVVLHGSPGLSRDFSLLASHLHENGVRVVIPDLPDFTAYKPGIFRHSDEERAQLIKDFLKKIDVTTIDMLICHSSSIYPALRLCLENDCPSIRSLTLLNAGVFKLMRAIKPYWAAWLLVRLSEFSLGLRLLQFFGTFLLKMVNAPVRLTNIMDPLLSATVMYYSNFSQGEEKLRALVAQNLPILFAFGENDRLMDKRFSYEIAYLLGANDEDIFHYDEDGRLSHPGVETQFVKVMAFKKGSHYVFQKYPEAVNEAVTSFLFKVLGNH